MSEHTDLFKVTVSAGVMYVTPTLRGGTLAYPSILTDDGVEDVDDPAAILAALPPFAQERVREVLEHHAGYLEQQAAAAAMRADAALDDARRACGLREAAKEREVSDDG